MELSKIIDSSYNFEYVLVGGKPWFRAKPVAEALAYADTDQAIRAHVHPEDKRSYSDLFNTPVNFTGVTCETCKDQRILKNTLFVNESGLYSLIGKSKKPDAVKFQRWITSEVLPSLRETGTYTISSSSSSSAAIEPPRHFTRQIEDIKTKHIMHINNEQSLHTNVVDFIRRKYPDAILHAGLGEMQHTDHIRLMAWRKGYQKGTADISILNRHYKYEGFVIELKTPNGTGRLDDKQVEYLRNMEINGYKVLISNDYSDIILQISEYMEGVRIVCPQCKKRHKFYKNKDSLNNHLMTFHRCCLNDVIISG